MRRLLNLHVQQIYRDQIQWKRCKCLIIVKCVFLTYDFSVHYKFFNWLHVYCVLACDLGPLPLWFFSVAKQKYLFHIPIPCRTHPPNYDLDGSMLGPLLYIFFSRFVKICVPLFPFIWPLCIYISSSEVTEVSSGHPWSTH